MKYKDTKKNILKLVNWEKNHKAIIAKEDEI